MKSKYQGNIGFEGRVFLTEAEHSTYLRRLPSRVNHKHRKELCEVCHKPAAPGNPLETSHVIPFAVGVVQFKLTPEFLDGAHNLKTAHKKMCNKAVEVDKEGAKKIIADYITNQLTNDKLR